VRLLKSIALYAVVLALAPLAILEITLRFLPVSYPPHLTPVTPQDPVARFVPNVEYRYSAGPDFAIRTLKRTNNYGYHHYADYDPRDRSPLLMVIGDSFVEAQAIDKGKTSAELLHAQVQGKGRAYSIGVSGAPLSQYLVFAQYASRTFRPDALAIVIIGNDFDESLLKYKTEPRFHYFEERDGKLALKRVDYELSGTKKILRQSAFLRYLMYNLQAEHRLPALVGRAGPRTYAELPRAGLETRVRDSERAVDYFFERLPEMSGLEPAAVAFVLDAVRPWIYSEAGLKEAEHGYHARLRRYFAAQARALGYEVIDMQPVFIARHRADGARFEFPTDSHWNELGHRMVAEALAQSSVFARVFGDRGLVRARNEPPPVAPKGLGAAAEVQSGKL
jgi:hypothetical protein